MMRRFATPASMAGMSFLVGCSGGAFETARSGAADASAKQSGGTASSAGGAPSAGRTGASSGTVAGSPSSGAGGGVGNAGSPTSSGGVIGSAGAMGTGGTVSIDASVGDATAPPSSCNSPADCPSPGTVCQTAACLGNQCGFVAAPNATPPGNVRGDCRKIVCSQSGTETILADPSDADDGNECTVDSCQDNVATHTAQVGSHCKNGSGLCDSTGACVQCLGDSDCPNGSGECATQQCVQGTCRIPPSGTLCNGGVDQCDGQGNCVDCVDSGGCDQCCFCLQNICVQG